MLGCALREHLLKQRAVTGRRNNITRHRLAGFVVFSWLVTPVAIALIPGVHIAAWQREVHASALASDILPPVAAAPPATLLRLDVSPGFSFAFVGGGSPLTAAASYDDRAMHPTVVTWVSADPTVARVDSNGNYTGLKAGLTTITALAEGVTSNPVTISVADPPTPPAQSVAPTPLLLRLDVSPVFSFAFVGGGSPLAATPIFNDGATHSTVVRWESADTTVARVDANGNYVGQKAGLTTITASSGGVTSNPVAISIADPPAPPATLAAASPATLLRLDVSPGFSFAFVGGGSPLTAAASYDDRAMHPTVVTWVSADPTVARVDSNGNYTGLKAGLTTITALAEGVTSNPVTISVADPPTPPAQSAAPTSLLPAGHSFDVPRENACNSPYDRYVMSEPGVYAYWALCEQASNDIGNDYVGVWPLLNGFGASSSVLPSTLSPVSDGEGSSIANDALGLLGNQGFVINKYAGTIAAWINADGTVYPVGAVAFTAVGGPSSAAIKIAHNSDVCFIAEIINSAGLSAQANRCGFTANTWHRVAMTWAAGFTNLYVDGMLESSSQYTGTLEDKIFFERLFPGCCSTGKAMRLAKVAVSNQAWSAEQIAIDYQPEPVSPPPGGVFITTDEIGTIHRDVMGYVDHNVDLSSASNVAALLSGLRSAGVTSVRYAGGFAGYDADEGDWRNGLLQCSGSGQPVTAQNQLTTNNLDHFMAAVGRPLDLSVGYTVNYGSNPPACDAGGDPVTNGASLVRYANLDKGYGVKYFEIGNEAGAYGGPLVDLHNNPYLRSGSFPTSYTANEPLFYTTMKAMDPSIQIGVPVAGVSQSYNVMTNYELPVLTGSKFDAVVLHAYPVQTPTTDGATLYQDRVAAGTGVRGLLKGLQTQLLNVAKPSDAIWVTEWGTEVAGAKWSRQTMGAVAPLFVVAQLSEFMQVGVPYATYWVQDANSECSEYNFDTNAATAYNWTDECGNPALVYTGRYDDGERSVGLKPGDLTPAARGFQILSESGFVSEGEHMLRTVPDSLGSPWLLAYAATHDGSQAVILINRDRDLTHIVPVQLGGRLAGDAVDQWTYGREQYDESRHGNWGASPIHTRLPAWSNLFNAVLPPWSVTILRF